MRFITINEGVLQAIEEGSECFNSCYKAGLAENTELAREVVQQTIAMLVVAPRKTPWGGYLVVDEETVVVVGTCAFKTAPTPDGIVEIAYFTFPMFEGQGYGTKMAEKLIAIAAASPEVCRVIAHTSPEPNASTRILEKVGMKLVGEVNDPEDGRVWRWEVEKAV